ncbi:hypothetical protein NEOLEDRAFT_1072627 [Neolentinus lepideus HHB14362 ss-1]|uniref:ferric-chelate reductase (NADPH) n=1 Tax=Neolentinus lepideus HHB14362 ss-1 TaxID=1314782 RepID=A0A165Q5A9_9AGAM|nr:hypothetical protein NEOLEDRAFT_1072627 [Neolentinus lepideus HHB14362 ss-1]
MAVSAAASSSSGHGAANNALRKYYQSHYPKEIWWLFGALIALLTAVRLVSLVFYFVRRWRFRYRAAQQSLKAANSNEKDPESGHGGSTPFPVALRIPAALINAWKIVWFRSTINFGFGYTLNVAEVVLTAAYIVALFTWSFVHSTSLPSQNLTLNWWANRTGTIAAAQFPLITTLGTKNNKINVVDQLNYLHRMTSRVALVLLWVHGGARIHIMALGSSEDWHTGWLRAGFMAVIGLSTLVLVSIRPIRERRYEFFVWFHFIVVLIFLVGAYFHVRQYAFGPYIWPCFLIWALDRSLRLARVVAFAASSYLFPRTSSTSLPSSTSDSKATVTALSPHLLQLRVPRPRGFHWAPGQTAYLVLPGVSNLPCEAHPFTIASSDPHPPTQPDELVFFIGVQTGVTRKLQGLVERGNGTARVRALVDGPYGRGADLAGGGAYDAAVLVAGGTGVAWAGPVFADAVRAKELGSGGRLRRVVFVWAIRERSHIKWIASTLSRTLAVASTVPTLSVSVRVHVTAPTESWDDDSVHSPSDRSSDENEKEGDVGIEGVEILSGRPDLREVVREEMRGAGREMFVGVCGSASLAGAVKDAVRVNPLWGEGSVVRGGPSVELVVESFGYA